MWLQKHEKDERDAASQPTVTSHPNKDLIKDKRKENEGEHHPSMEDEKTLTSIRETMGSRRLRSKPIPSTIQKHAITKEGPNRAIDTGGGVSTMC
ncbi:hypothetical protein V6N13_126772 [Hibiscus sabdariffa]|uniref:Uncharacterized protein n=1 Tax=Hibiscus sabdariffa TaxID=183260 RepID=A0ABR2REP1_9ROSI